MTDTSELAAKIAHEATLLASLAKIAREKLVEYNTQQEIEDEFGRAPKKGYKLVRNILSGLLCEIPEDTHRCCDPSTELYHSM